MRFPPIEGKVRRQCARHGMYRAVLLPEVLPCVDHGHQPGALIAPERKVVPTGTTHPTIPLLLNGQKLDAAVRFHFVIGVGPLVGPAPVAPARNLHCLPTLGEGGTLG